MNPLPEYSFSDLTVTNSRQLRRMILAGESRDLIGKILAVNDSEEALDHTISSVMTALEALSDSAPDVAFILMAHLWDIASGRMLHDICDAIDLYFFHSPNLALALYISAYKASEPGDDFSEYSVRWLDYFNSDFD